MYPPHSSFSVVFMETCTSSLPIFTLHFASIPAYETHMPGYDFEDDLGFALWGHTDLFWLWHICTVLIIEAGNMQFHILQ